MCIVFGGPGGHVGAKTKKNKKKQKNQRLGDYMRPDISLKSLVFLAFFRESDVWKGRERKAEEKNLGVFALKVRNAPKSFQTIFH